MGSSPEEQGPAEILGGVGESQPDLDAGKGPSIADLPGVEL